MPVSSRLTRNVPSIRPTVGKFCTPAKPASLHLAQEAVHQPERVGAADAGQHRRVAGDRQHLAGHVHHDRVGVAVGHQAGERAAARHPVAARVVDDDQVGAAVLGALGRQAGARAGADDQRRRRRASRAAARGPRRPSRQQLVQLVGHRRRERLVVDVVVQLDHLDVGLRGPRRTTPRRPRGRGRAGPRRRSARRPRRGMKSTVGPVAADSLRAIRRPSSAHSSGVVRISVTDGLCT